MTFQELGIQLIGLIAALLASAMFIPQAYRVWKDRNDFKALEGVSSGSMILAAVQGFLWVIYNGAMGAWWGVIPNAFIIPLAVFVLIYLNRAKRLSAK